MLSLDEAVARRQEAEDRADQEYKLAVAHAETIRQERHRRAWDEFWQAVIASKAG